MTRRMGLWAAALAVGMALCGCAEPVEDIDRTQANLLRKSDLEGEPFFPERIYHYYSVHLKMTPQPSFVPKSPRPASRAIRPL